MTLESRLQAVADFIAAPTHLDIGSDHALLPRYLLLTKRIQKAIVVEKNQQPFENARGALQGLNADVRLGDGFAVVQASEAQSLSVSGLGAKTIIGILSEYPERLPNALILQANANAKPLRMWARAHGFHLKAESMAQGFWRYSILRFEKAPGDDPAYKTINLDVALTYGPHLLREKHPILREELEYQQPYLEGLGDYGKNQLDVLKQALEFFNRL
ncbi:MAG: tRNA (adenine(22)-N(1))-methyltransferase [Trueperaceae bacterium]